MTAATQPRLHCAQCPARFYTEWERIAHEREAHLQPRCADCKRFIERKKAVNQELALEGALNLMAKDIEAEFDKDMPEWEREFPGLCDESEVM